VHALVDGDRHHPVETDRGQHEGDDTKEGDK
jgi:hypothetical protein